MVQAAPNKTDLEGVVTSHSPKAKTSAFDLLVVLLERATPVPGLADLLSPRVGSSIDVLAQRDHVPAEIVGKRIGFRAQLIGPGIARLDPTVPILAIP